MQNNWVVLDELLQGFLWWVRINQMKELDPEIFNGAFFVERRPPDFAGKRLLLLTNAHIIFSPGWRRRSRPDLKGQPKWVVSIPKVSFIEGNPMVARSLLSERERARTRTLRDKILGLLNTRTSELLSAVAIEPAAEKYLTIQQTPPQPR